MYINKKKKGYGWYSTVSTKDIGLDKPLYMDFAYKKGCEPDELEMNQDGSVVGDLYFITNNTKRKVFPVAKEYNGHTYIEFKLLESELDAVKSYYRSDIKGTIDNPIREGDVYDGVIEDGDLPW